MPKTPFRREILTKRLLHQSSEVKHIKDKNIQASLEDMPEFKSAKKILFYAPINGEVDTFAIMEKWVNKKELYLPKTNKKDHRLYIHKITSLDDFKIGAFGIPEPHKNSEEIQPGKLDLVVVPGVVFDKTGHRIGFGLGYYDRMLKKTRCPKIGLAYEFQIIENIPGEPHDVPVNIVITNKRIINTQNP